MRIGRLKVQHQQRRIYLDEWIRLDEEGAGGVGVWRVVGVKASG